MEDLTLHQLTALAGVSDRLEEAGIDYSLFGGWAVDLYVGLRHARPRDDPEEAAKDRADFSRLSRVRA